MKIWVVCFLEDGGFGCIVFGEYFNEVIIEF